MHIPDELNHVLTCTPDILGGSVRFAGTRVPVQALIDTLEAGEGIEEFLEGWPDVSREQAIVVIQWQQNESRKQFGLSIAS